MSAIVWSDLLELLVEGASAWTGFRPDAILRHAVAAVAETRLRGCTAQQLEQAIRGSEPTLVHDICQAVSVGETYFFRSPDQFDHAVELVAGRFGERATIRAWSAGCATGEEAYSMAGLLLQRFGAMGTQVIGTDLVAKNIDTARLAKYGPWSVRESRRPPGVLESDEARGLRVAGHVRKLVSFTEHNLLDPLPEGLGKFHLIFCRNVLIYFDRIAAERVLRHLVDALLPDGVLCFGTMDLADLPPTLRRLDSELQVYERSDSSAPIDIPARPTARKPPQVRVKPQPTVRRPPAAPPAAAAPVDRRVPEPPPAEPVAVHLRALALIEAGTLDEADKLLEQLCSKAHAYLPGFLERALLHLRLGERKSGEHLLHELIERAYGRRNDEVLAAPEPMTVAFLRASAQAVLDQVPRGAGSGPQRSRPKERTEQRDRVAGSHR